MQSQLDRLENEGYTIFPAFLDLAMAERLRAHIDALLPPLTDSLEPNAKRVHDLRHPIPGAIMAELVDNPKLLELAGRLLGSDDLRMLEQVLIRSDPGDSEAGPMGWHIDFAFGPNQYNAVPRQTYFQMVHALNTVPPGGAPLAIVPGSHKLTYAAAAKMSTDDEFDELKARPIEIAGIDVARAIEVRPQAGDLVVFNPMALHSASRNISEQPRYVYFTSFMHPSAARLQEYMRKTAYPRAFPASLRENLRPELHYLLDA